MDKLYVLERAQDGKRVEFYSELRKGKLTYIIRETSGASQDSITTDPDMVKEFRQHLLRDGYLETSS
ncbi:MAG: hypothetical protein ACHQ7M_07330 [Chloroflexota bacterium]